MVLSEISSAASVSSRLARSPSQTSCLRPFFRSPHPRKCCQKKNGSRKITQSVPIRRIPTARLTRAEADLRRRLPQQPESGVGAYPSGPSPASALAPAARVRRRRLPQRPESGIGAYPSGPSPASALTPAAPASALTPAARVRHRRLRQRPESGVGAYPSSPSPASALTPAARRRTGRRRHSPRCREPRSARRSRSWPRPSAPRRR